MLLVWGIVYDNSVANVEIWGKAANMIALPGYSSRICYLVTDDYEKDFSFNYGESVTIVSRQHFDAMDECSMIRQSFGME